MCLFFDVLGCLIVFQNQYVYVRMHVVRLTRYFACSSSPWRLTHHMNREHVVEDAADKARKNRKSQPMRVPLEKLGFWPSNQGGLDAGQWLSAKPSIGAMGDQAEGIIDTDFKNHHKKFRNFVYGSEEENDMFLGAHTMSLIVDKSDVFACELLLRGVGRLHHSFPAGLPDLWTCAERKDFIYLELRVVNCLYDHHLLSARYAFNCASCLMTPLVISELATTKERMYVELEDFPDCALLSKLKHADLEVLIDDAPPEQWHQIPELLERFDNIKGVKIDLTTSLTVLQKSEPMLAPGIPNDFMKSKLSNVPQSRTDKLREDFKLLAEEVVKHGKCKLVIECDCDLTDFEWTGCAKDLARLKLLYVQGKDDHAVVQRIFCDYQKLSIDSSAVEKHVPQRHRL